MGLIDWVLGRNKEIELSLDLDLAQDAAKRLHMKRLVIDTCVSFLARTIGQTEFRVKKNGEYVKDELYYRLNVRPNKNMTSSTFWQEVVHKLIYDNEVLIIQADDGDLLIADTFERNIKAVYEDTFTDVVVKDFKFIRSFSQGGVIHLRFANENLEKLISSIYDDYGELFGRVLAAQKRKDQIRSTVKINGAFAKTKDAQEKLQTFIDRMYSAIDSKDVAIVPQQDGFEYGEVGKGGSSLSVDEVNKVTGGFLSLAAMAIGIPVSLLFGEMADVEKQTKNYMLYTVKPLLKKIKDEADVKFFEKEEYMNGSCLDPRPISYQNIFDLATSIDKLRSSGAFSGNEIRHEAGYEGVDSEFMNSYFITKNYQEAEEAMRGGETNDQSEVLQDDGS